MQCLYPKWYTCTTLARRCHFSILWSYLYQMINFVQSMAFDDWFLIVSNSKYSVKMVCISRFIISLHVYAMNDWLWNLNLQPCKIFNNYLEPTKSICVIMLIPIDNFFCLIFFVGNMFLHDFHFKFKSYSTSPLLSPKTKVQKDN
jgi:hypothetical protein